MVILSLLAIGLGRQTHVELTLAKHFKGKIQSKYIAFSGLIYAIDLLKKDTLNKDLIKPDVFNPEIFSKPFKIGSGSFRIVQLQDEESKININAVTTTNYLVLSNLLTQVGVDEQTALTISSSVIDWIDDDTTVFNAPYGSEDETYKPLGYESKNQPFESVQELLLIRGMNKNIFQKIKDFITIDPAQGPFLINLDMASVEVLHAFARSFCGPQTNTSIEDADNLVEKIMDYRKTLNSINSTAQERALESNKISLNSKESAIFQMMQSQRQKTPQYIHIQVTGIDDTTKATTDLHVTIKRNELSLLHWQRN